jgi:ubiquinone/menaquinone biosynthesis C-methylase UbiE
MSTSSPQDQPAIQAASAVAAWRRYDEDEQRLSAHVSERMLDLAGLRPGARVLDIATGRGEPAIRAALRVAPGGVVVGTDVSPDMLAFAQTRAEQAGVANLTLLATGGEDLDGLPEPLFDAALCRWGFMYFDRPTDALKAVRAHLVHGGKLVSALWTAPESASWWSWPRRILDRYAAQPPMSLDAPGPFRYGRAEAFHRDLMAAGFQVTHEETLQTSVMESPDPEGLVEWCLTFGLARALAGHPESVRQAWRHDMLAQAEGHRHPDGMYRLGGLTRLVVARAA